MKSVASIPANYVSILELQERWLKEKGRRKHKEKELLLTRGVKQQIDGQQRREEGVMKVVEAMEPREKLDEKECVEKAEELEKEENGGDLRETKKIQLDSIGKGTQFQDRWTKKRVEEFNGAARLNSGKGYYRNQRHDWSSRRVIRETGAMVWVKKGKNDGAAAENENGV